MALPARHEAGLFESDSGVVHEIGATAPSGTVAVLFRGGAGGQARSSHFGAGLDSRAFACESVRHAGVHGFESAVPFSYKSLELNEALIDWFNPQQTYNDVVIAAANETGDGMGFVTEMASPTNDPNNGSISDRIFVERFAIQEFRNTADGMTDAELIVDIVSRFSTFNGFAFTGPFGGAMSSSGQVALDGVADVLARNLVLPPGTSVADVMSAPRCHFGEFQMEDTFYCEGRRAPAQRINLQGFDRTDFLTDVEDLIILPLEETVQLFTDQPYMTRFYTTLSPDEMTVDPVFALNADLMALAALRRRSLARKRPR